VKTSEKIEMLAAAMAKAQGALEAASKDHRNPNFNSRYADLASLWSAARKPLSSNGLSVLQEATYADGNASVTTRVLHESGQWIEFEPLLVPLTKQKWKNEKGEYEMVYDAHGVGGGITYAKRFAFGTAIGLVAEDEDDDGNEASGRGEIDTDQDLPARKPARTAAAKTRDGIPPCPKCGSNADTIVSKRGPGFYCFPCKNSWDPVRQQALSDPQVEQYAEAFE
jgi:hypothetical protein